MFPSGQCSRFARGDSLFTGSQIPNSEIQILYLESNYQLLGPAVAGPADYPLVPAINEG
jgi:hypothetical protein